MVRIVSFDANGIRAAARKGFFTWVAACDPDILCIQETKAQEHQVPPEALLADRYVATFVDAQKKGYSGVAVYTRRAPDAIVRGTGIPDIDAEGRFLRVDCGGLTIVSVYFPSGTSGPARQAVKMGFLERMLPLFVALRREGRSVVVCGDFNIAHRDIDVFDVRAARGVTGFLPDERAWLDDLFGPVGWADAMRVVDPEPRRFTWWSNYPGQFEGNNGWRIDYQAITPDLVPRVRAAAVERDARFSDHAPLTIDYDL